MGSQRAVVVLVVVLHRQGENVAEHSETNPRGEITEPRSGGGL